MTPLEPVAQTSLPRPEPEPEPAAVAGAGAGAGPSMGRPLGVDLARALAVFGMFAVHVGPIEAAPGDVGGWLRSLSEGRASALFAMLAGFSLMLIAGGPLEYLLNSATKPAKVIR